MLETVKQFISNISDIKFEDILDQYLKDIEDKKLQNTVQNYTSKDTLYMIAKIDNIITECLDLIQDISRRSDK